MRSIQKQAKLLLVLFKYSSDIRPSDSLSYNVTKILVDGGYGNGNDSRYIWKFKSMEYRWKEYNQESFYIENAFENKILAVADGDGSLKMAHETEEKLKSTWAMFYVRWV